MNQEETITFTLEYERLKFEKRLTALQLAREESAQRAKNVDEVIELAKKYLSYLEGE